jgi:hypothetical protein
MTGITQRQLLQQLLGGWRQVVNTKQPCGLRRCHTYWQSRHSSALRRREHASLLLAHHMCVLCVCRPCLPADPGGVLQAG